MIGNQSKHNLGSTEVCQERDHLRGLELENYDDNNEGKSQESLQPVEDDSKPWSEGWGHCPKWKNPQKKKRNTILVNHTFSFFVTHAHNMTRGRQLRRRTILWIRWTWVTAILLGARGVVKDLMSNYSQKGWDVGCVNPWLRWVLIEGRLLVGEIKKIDNCWV